MASVEELLQPVSEEAPAGPDLEDEPEWQVLLQAFDRPVSIDPDGNVTQSSDVDWREVVTQIEELSGRTKNVWLPVYLCRAGALWGRIDLVEKGALYLAGLVDAFWETMHPSLAEYEFQGRKGACDSLVLTSSFLLPLERTPLLEHPRLGRFSGADFERFRASTDADGYGLFRKALEEAPPETLPDIITRLKSIIEALGRADATLTSAASASGETSVNFEPTYSLLRKMMAAVQSFSTAPADAEAPAESEAADGSVEGEPAGGGGPRIAGRVETREDVIKALDAVADYYRRREPASPVPSALQRVREWVNLDFMALLEDIAPGALDEAKRVLMSQRKPPSESSW